MSYRTVFLLAVLVAIASSASAQSLQRTAPAVSSASNSASDVPVVLDVRWLTVSDNLIKNFRPSLDKLPGMGAWVVRDEKQLDMLLFAMQSDKRSNAMPSKAISLKNGKECDFSPYGLNRDIQGKDSVQATLAKNRRTVDIRLTWAKWKDGTNRLPVTTASVPLGSHLVVHTQETFEAGQPLQSFWQQLGGSIFGQKNIAVGRERVGGYFVISPRTLVNAESQLQTAAR